eukprot:7388552-Pyramimonas_sp.AAC.1
MVLPCRFLGADSLMQPGHALLGVIWAVRCRSSDSSHHLLRLLMPLISILQRHAGVDVLCQPRVRPYALPQ